LLGLGTMRFLIHDRDQVFTAAFGDVFKGEGLRIITTLPRTPRMNATCERVIGPLRRELLDRTLILGERHLALVLREYLIHYNRHSRTSPGGNGPRTSKRSPSGTWPTCGPSAEDPSLQD
jgi:transposase InsO family protein